MVGNEPGSLGNTTEDNIIIQQRCRRHVHRSIKLLRGPRRRVRISEALLSRALSEQPQRSLGRFYSRAQRQLSRSSTATTTRRRTDNTRRTVTRRELKQPNVRTRRPTRLRHTLITRYDNTVDKARRRRDTGARAGRIWYNNNWLLPRFARSQRSQSAPSRRIAFCARQIFIDLYRFTTQERT